MASPIGQLLQKKSKTVLESWINIQLQDDGLKEELLSNQEIRKQSEEFLQSVISILKKEDSQNTESPEFEKAAEILTEITTSRAMQGYTPRETGVFVFSLKEAFLSVLEKEFKDGLVPYADSQKINKLIDALAILTFETFISSREEVILRQTSEISEISTPVIRVWDGILALPIIGTLDSARTQVVMENLLMKIVETESTIAILDISGVPAVDSLVAQHLIKTVSATRLMGAECIISGIRPEIAQTIVHLGIDLANINTKASLAHALRSAFMMLKLEVRKTAEKPKF
ncbi:MAG: anti-anti-sigma factor [Ferruginibacter sp.]|jgi:rsbT co-antagonist protein RsbR|uniref:STAS domain-containing protein n=1 Tax=Ferruginibacter sp. TaxID=1940288 RepID=UPI00265A16AD|nr:STAS domain-containing protein [Ferruginibacter sp.]MDB5276445.1 anti-anti-sigma factor [Ferruginibacter sp.]